MEKQNITSVASTKRGRNRQQTETDILAAVGRVLARDGFTGIGINVIAHEANIDKVLIYRYFGGMPQLLEAFGLSGNFWPSVDQLIAGLDLATLPLALRLQMVFERFIDALRSSPLTLEILAMEVTAPNELTATLDAARERWGRDLAERLAGEHPITANWNINISLLFAGIQYLLLRARNTVLFSGMAIQEDECWQEIKKSLSWLCLRMTQAEEQ
ncbi:TetR/AcrR family transcriptional regulator [Serratia aquatilis]|uniref:TetR/AcrR family transcriptional regulator n=1 Tax=Serratia aquatilis TaxID=1737515 RepID=A0ABV6EDC7_9GAMM